MYSKEEYIKSKMSVINEMINDKKPKFEIARVIGVKYDTLKKYMKEWGINYSGNQSRKGMPHTEGKTPIEEYFNGNIRINACKLKKRLLEEGFKEDRCEKCGLTEWMGEKITLELHHKNMDHYDNSLENLQILCPNCHALVHKQKKSDDK